MIKYKKESGYTLIGTLLIFVIASIFGISLVTASLASLKISTTERENQSVYYVAEAGVTNKLNEIEKKLDETYKEVSNYIKHHYINKDKIDEKLTTDQINSEARKLFYNKLKAKLLILNDNQKYEKFETENTFSDVYIKDVDYKEGLYEITSKGKMGEQRRKVVKQIQIHWENKYKVEKGKVDPNEPPPLTVLTSGNMSLTNGPVVGNIGTLSTDKHAIKIGSGVLKVTEDIYVPYIENSNDNRNCVNPPGQANKYSSYSVQRPTSENNAPCPKEVKDMWKIPDLPDFPKLPTNNKVPRNDYINEYQVIKDGDLLINNSRSDYYELNMDELGGNLRFENIIFNSNRNLTINIGESDKHIVVDHLNIQNGHIHLRGKGNLTLFVKNKITMGAGSTINRKGNINSNNHINQLNIFYSGKSDINLSGSQEIYGSLYAQSADLNLTGSGSIYGNIFTGGSSLKISGGSEVESQLILAPYANTVISGGGNIYGRIISNTFIHNSGQKVIDGEPFIIEGPISPEHLAPGQGSNIKNEVVLTNAGKTIEVISIRESDIHD